MVLNNSCRDQQRGLSLGLDCPDFNVIERVSLDERKDEVRSALTEHSFYKTQFSLIGFDTRNVARCVHNSIVERV